MRLKIIECENLWPTKNWDHLIWEDFLFFSFLCCLNNCFLFFTHLILIPVAQRYIVAPSAWNTVTYCPQLTGFVILWLLFSIFAFWYISLIVLVQTVVSYHFVWGHHKKKLDPLLFSRSKSVDNIMELWCWFRLYK